MCKTRPMNAVRVPGIKTKNGQEQNLDQVLSRINWVVNLEHVKSMKNLWKILSKKQSLVGVLFCSKLLPCYEHHF